jgi:hypothetical protein
MMIKTSSGLGVETLRKPFGKKRSPVRHSRPNDRTKPSETLKANRRTEDYRDAVILHGDVGRRKRLLLAALRVWELKHRAYYY